MQTGLPFTPALRMQCTDAILRVAESDNRITAAAFVGSTSSGASTRWSDIDLTFGVSDSVAVADVLESYTAFMRAELGASVLFDVPRGATIYRVFILPNCLQVDLSFTPQSQFGAKGPRFELLWGSAVDQPYVPELPAHHILGTAVHHALRARISIERCEWWQAEYWIGETRHHALSLACLRHGVPALYGRGLDQLPSDLLAQ
jgi:hypothetical protein